MSAAEIRPRTRREELLTIAADLFATRGFPNVTVDELGDAAGVSGPALYHHFAGKDALLGEMLIGISEQLLAGGARLAAEAPADLPERLILFHSQFAVDNRSLITVHFRDLIHATAADQYRVRRLQARYAAIWVDAVSTRYSGLDARTARAAVHATLGLINSTPFSSTLPRARMIDLLVAMAGGALGQLAPDQLAPGRRPA
ncbi:MAG: TetR/AcrR family transcriptional regulator [Acidimicrobiia bacterium]